MAGRTTFRRVLTIPYQANSLVERQIDVSGKVRRLWLELRGTLNNTVAGGGAITRGPGTLVPSLMLTLDRDKIIKQGSWNDFRDRMAFHYRLPNEVTHSNAVSAIEVLSRIEIPFVTPQSASPVSSVLDMDRWQRLDLAVQWADENAILNAGTKAWTVAPVINVIAEVSRFDSVPTHLYREHSFDVGPLGTTANANLRIPLPVAARQMYHHLLLSAEDLVATTLRAQVTTALNNVAVEAQDGGEVFVPFGGITGQQLAQEAWGTFRCIDAIQNGLYYIPFQPRFDGMWSFTLDAAELDQLALLIDHAAFTTNGFIRVMYGIMEPLYSNAV